MPCHLVVYLGFATLHFQLFHLFLLCNIKLWYQASLGAPDTSVEFQRVNSRISVAMMVFAPIYVAQMISSYLRDKAESDKLRKIRHENQENDSGAPSE